MAEFADVIKQAARMCKAYGGECRKCPAEDSKHHVCMIWPEAIEYRYSTPEQAEQIVMDWAAKHPEPRYPSWNEAWKQLFPDGQRTPCPGCFGRKYAPEWCGHEECGKCKDAPSPSTSPRSWGQADWRCERCLN